MSKKLIVLVLSLVLFVSACAKTNNNTNDSSKDDVVTDSSSVVSENDGDLIEVRPAKQTGNGATVNKVHVAKSGATVISISKKKDNDNLSSGTTSSGSSSSSGSQGDKDPYSELPLDFVLDFDTENINILQLSDFMVIDSSQQRPETMMGDADTLKYAPSKKQELLFDEIKATVDKAKPDLILVTGDLVMGFYDDLGTSFEAVINYMDSLKIFWAPVFGTYDNSSAQGVEWQCNKLKESKYCLFKRGNSIGGNSNYSIGLGVNGELSRVIYMMDSNGCINSTDPAVVTTAGIKDTQLQWVETVNNSLKEKDFKVPSFACFNLASSDILDAVVNAGYEDQSNTAVYEIGKDVTAKNQDFGVKGEPFATIFTNDKLLNTFKTVGVDGVFMGSNPLTDISVLYNDIRWTIGLKTGKYYNASRTGGMLIKLSSNSFKVSEILI